MLEPRYVLLLALLNDVTMLAVAYDNATPSSSPDLPTIQHLVQVWTLEDLLRWLRSITLARFLWLTYLVAWSAVLSGVTVVRCGADGRVVALLPQWIPLHHDPGTPYFQ